MIPKFRISNIVPNMSEGIVTAFYVWDDGHVDSFAVPVQTATLEGLMQIGFERQAWFEERELKLAEIAQQALELSEEENGSIDN